MDFVTELRDAIKAERSRWSRDNTYVESGAISAYDKVLEVINKLDKYEHDILDEDWVVKDGQSDDFRKGYSVVDNYGDRRDIHMAFCAYRDRAEQVAALPDALRALQILAQAPREREMLNTLKVSIDVRDFQMILATLKKACVDPGDVITGERRIKRKRLVGEVIEGYLDRDI